MGLLARMEGLRKHVDVSPAAIVVGAYFESTLAMAKEVGVPTTQATIHGCL